MFTCRQAFKTCTSMNTISNFFTIESSSAKIFYLQLSFAFQNSDKHIIIVQLTRLLLSYLHLKNQINKQKYTHLTKG